MDRMDSPKEVLHGQREPSDLPAGMMLVARHFDEPAIYRAASAFEKAGEWRGVRP
jgi:Asp-tRNA(Asn)/Glu-tRNA(Gln) amidotransferase A subunit family amidase